ncbi:hypothetical protein BDA96_02G306200 [Sorghum bicolor]|uniref:Uncharacterized protein n=2 Tax=Sorghum bicolor TaxID=4558 RepID=A0A1W0W692_SORBI|nr:hypothetical protein BDA96_02G306200 [Sorghum bicolor]OQU89899.1 hypothetical protein SORBI_3002G291132 [Sorghum bicolor]OQU89900.1 hypothetical protein SORBI_3002G291132 [Sorghum bicolor]
MASSVCKNPLRGFTRIGPCLRRLLDPQQGTSLPCRVDRREHTGAAATARTLPLSPQAKRASSVACDVDGEADDAEYAGDGRAFHCCMPSGRTGRSPLPHAERVCAPHRIRDMRVGWIHRRPLRANYRRAAFCRGRCSNKSGRADA